MKTQIFKEICGIRIDMYILTDIYTTQYDATQEHKYFSFSFIPRLQMYIVNPMVKVLRKPPTHLDIFLSYWKFHPKLLHQIDIKVTSKVIQSLKHVMSSSSDKMWIVLNLRSKISEDLESKFYTKLFEYSKKLSYLFHPILDLSFYRYRID